MSFLKNKFVTLLVMLGVIFASITSASATDMDSKALKVGGTYRVYAIDQDDSNQFRVEFRAIAPSGEFDRLVLHTDHINFSVRKGAEVRLSAEVLEKQASYAEVSQVVIFMPSPQGAVPVWMLSSKNKGRDLRGTKYLKMHAPTTDYQIF